MSAPQSNTNIVRGMAVLSVLELVGVLLYYLPQPGYSQSRLVLFGLIAGAAVLGGAGVVLRRATLTAVGVFGLFSLGFGKQYSACSSYPLPLFSWSLLFWTDPRTPRRSAPSNPRRSGPHRFDRPHPNLGPREIRGVYLARESCQDSDGQIVLSSL